MRDARKQRPGVRQPGYEPIVVSRRSENRSSRSRVERADRAGWWVATVLVVIATVIGYLADGLPAALVMGGLSAVGVAIGVVWWFRVGRRRYE